MPPPKPSRERSSQSSLRDSFQSSPSGRDTLECSPSKRPKLSHSSSHQSVGAPAASAMYDFSRPNHIDLTNGPATMTTVAKKPAAMARQIDASVQSGPKQLIVKNLRQTPKTDPEKYFNQILSQLDAALSAILINEKVRTSNELLYQGVENLCRQGRAAPLFKVLCEKCKEGITSQFEKPLVTQASTLDNTALLRSVMESWEAWNIRLVWLRGCWRHGMF